MNTCCKSSMTSLVVNKRHNKIHSDEFKFVHLFSTNIGSSYVIIVPSNIKGESLAFRIEKSLIFQI